MRETWDLIQAWRSLPRDAQAVLATVVHTSGSTYRKAGARMLLSEKGRLAGSISGGCLEADLISTGWNLSVDGPKLVTYDATSDDDIVWGFGLGCNGMVEVLVERVTPESDVLTALAHSYEAGIAIVVATSLDEGIGIGKRWFFPSNAGLAGELASAATGMVGLRGQAVKEIDGTRFYLESHVAPRRLLVFGAGHDAPPLVSLAASLGWKVTVVDHREAYATPEQLPGASEIVVCPVDKLSEAVRVTGDDSAVVMSHHYLNDRAALGFLLGTDAAYIGVLGPAKRTQRMLQELALMPDARLHAPVGLDIGAEGPHEIALAIMAEIQAFTKGKQGASLNKRQAS